MPRKKTTQTKRNYAEDGSYNVTGKRANGTGTIVQRPNGRHQVQVAGRSKTFLTLREAEEYRAEVLTDMRRGTIGARAHTTFAEYTQEWLLRQTAKQVSTQRIYKWDLFYACESLGKLKLQDIKPQDIRQMIQAIQSRPMGVREGLELGTGLAMAASSQQKVMIRTRAVLNAAVADQIIFINPAAHVKLERPKRDADEEEPVGRVLDPREFSRFLAVGNALYEAGMCRLWPALYTCAAVGLRRGEVMALEWDDIDFEGNRLHVRKNRAVNPGKVVRGSTKTRSSRRTIPLPSSLKQMLERHRETQRVERERASVAWRETGALFATEQGNWTHPDNLNRALENVIKWTNLEDEKRGGRIVTFETRFRRRSPKSQRFELERLLRAGPTLPDITPHALRHTYATLALRRGERVALVSKILGHKNELITLSIYRHVTQDELEAHPIDLMSEDKAA